MLVPGRALRRIDAAGKIYEPFVIGVRHAKDAID
jgi:hypothetical protein